MLLSPPPSHPTSGELIQDIARQANYANDDERVLSHLRTTFRVIRNRASFEQSLQFLEMLPLPLKVIFLNDWHIVPQTSSPISSLDEWANEVLRHEQLHVIRDQAEARRILLAIFVVLNRKVGSKTLRNSLGFVSPELRAQLLEEPIENDQYADTCIWFS